MFVSTNFLNFGWFERRFDEHENIPRLVICVACRVYMLIFNQHTVLYIAPIGYNAALSIRRRMKPSLISVTSIVTGTKNFRNQVFLNSITYNFLRNSICLELGTSGRTFFSCISHVWSTKKGLGTYGRKSCGNLTEHAEHRM